MELFPEKVSKARIPLADRMRPRTFAEFLGQEDIAGDDKPLRKAIASDKIPSMIFWGPPGSGKTTLAKLIATETKYNFITFSAVTAGVKDIKEVVQRAKLTKGGTILFVDEIHRFNKAQQDAFLPFVEDGTITLIGATTENPSFELNSALLSRCRVFILHQLNPRHIIEIIQRAIGDTEQGLGKLNVKFAANALDFLADISNGDARVALNLLDLAVFSTMPEKGSRNITVQTLKDSAQKRTALYDKSGEEHYNVISAFIKSLRGSDPDAALYWLARMLESGEDPLFIARRMVILASEDIGNADPQAIMVAIAAKESVDFVGMPEGFLPLAQAATYLATAPKSNASYKAYLEARKDVEETRNDPVPLHLRNAVTKLMEDAGYHKGYKYSHDFPDAIEDQQYLPDNLMGKKYYHPKDVGFEREIRCRMDERQKRRNQK